MQNILRYGLSSSTDRPEPKLSRIPIPNTSKICILTTMELETFEMTVEDILNMHRGWIIQTFVQDRKTEVEIVQILQERQLIVT